jgi:hypothetical protein
MATKQVFHRAGWLFAALLSCLLVIGCKTPRTGPGWDSLASINLQGHSGLEIARVVSEDFKAAGWQAVPLPQNEGMRMQFDKPAGTGANIMYSDWSFKPIWYRARIELLKTGEDTYTVTCNAWRVFDRNSGHFEEEHKLSSMKSGPYQDLLDKVKVKLTAATPSESQPGAPKEAKKQ